MKLTKKRVIRRFRIEDNALAQTLFTIKAADQSFRMVDYRFYKKIGFNKKNIKYDFGNDFKNILFDENEVNKFLSKCNFRSDFFSNFKFKNNKIYAIGFKYFNVGDLYLCHLSELKEDDATSKTLNDDIIENKNYAFLDIDLVDNEYKLTKELADRFGFNYELKIRKEEGRILDKLNQRTRDFLKNIDLIPTSAILTKTIKLFDLDNNPHYFDMNYRVLATDHKNITKLIARLEDVTDAKKEIDELKTLSQIDLLTGLYNKITTEKKIEELLKYSINTFKHALVIIDLDDFKATNDNYGHRYGDSVIQLTSNILKEVFLESDIIGRVGGDEFIVLINNYENENVLLDKCQKLKDKLNETYEFKGNSVTLSASMGVAKFPDVANRFEDLYDLADKALYYSKKDGKNTFTIYKKDEIEPYLDAISLKKKSTNLNLTNLDLFSKLYIASGDLTFFNKIIIDLLQYSGFSRLEIQIWKNAKFNKTFCSTQTIESKTSVIENVSQEMLNEFISSDEYIQLYDFTLENDNSNVKKLVMFKLMLNNKFLGLILLDDILNSELKIDLTILKNFLSILSVYYLKYNEELK